MTELEREIKIYNILAYTHVRGKGSTYGRHPQRCLWNICGKSMLERALEIPLMSKYVNKVVLASEDQKILGIGRKMEGITIMPRSLDTVYDMPRDWDKGVFQSIRPRSLCSFEPFTGGLNAGIEKSYRRDDTRYVIWYLQKQESYVTDILIHVPANQPMSTTETLDKLIEAFFQDEEANWGHTFVPVMPYLFTINPKTGRPFPLFFSRGLDKQCYPDLYRQGPFTIWGRPKRTTYGEEAKIAYIVVSPEEDLDIHNKEDLFIANCYMKRRLLKEGKEVKWEIGQDNKQEEQKKEENK